MWAHELCTEVLLPATGSHPGNPRLERLMKKYLPQDSSMVQLIARESQRRGVERWKLRVVVFLFRRQMVQCV